MTRDTSTLLTDLRQRAESSLRRVVQHAQPNLAPENVEALVHELQVHQIELEMQCHELQRAQAEAEESRNRYQELYESVPVGYLTIDAAGRIYDMNPASMRLLGTDLRKTPVKNFFFFFRNGDVNVATLFCRNVLAQQEPGMRECNLKKADGTAFVAALQALPVEIGEGKGTRLRIAFQDITPRKEAEQRLSRQQAELEANQHQLQELTRKLFTVQEDERKRIARELHDDYCQRVTTLILEANLLKKSCGTDIPQLVPKLTTMSEKLSGILKGFRSLSHELLPRNLGDTLLAVPIRNLVKEFGERAEFEIKFFEQEVPAKIPPDVMTTIFRLLQESLCNVVKHASAKHVVVTLAGTRQGVELVIVDDGIGFDVASVLNGQNGMGIVSMRERVRLTGGTTKIVSQLGQGTTLIFSVPLSASSQESNGELN